MPAQILVCDETEMFTTSRAISEHTSSLNSCLPVPAPHLFPHEPHPPPQVVITDATSFNVFLCSGHIECADDWPRTQASPGSSSRTQCSPSLSRVLVPLNSLILVLVCGLLWLLWTKSISVIDSLGTLDGMGVTPLYLLLNMSLNNRDHLESPLTNANSQVPHSEMLIL